MKKQKEEIFYRWMIPFKGRMVRYSNNYKTKKECYKWLENYKRCVGDTLQDTDTLVISKYRKQFKKKMELV